MPRPPSKTLPADVGGVPLRLGGTTYTVYPLPQPLPAALRPHMRRLQRWLASRSTPGTTAYVMVASLPIDAVAALLADVIRGMAAGEGSGATAPMVVNISAVDASSVRRIFLTHREALAEGITAAARDGFLTQGSHG